MNVKNIVVGTTLAAFATLAVPSISSASNLLGQNAQQVGEKKDEKKDEKKKDEKKKDEKKGEKSCGGGKGGEKSCGGEKGCGGK